MFGSGLLHDVISSLRVDVWIHKTILTPQPLIEVNASYQEIKRLCVLGVSIWPLPTIVIFDFEIVPTVWRVFLYFMPIFF